MSDLFLGLLSGTSMDGIDAGLIRFHDRSVTLVRARRHDYPRELRGRLRDAALRPETCGVDELGVLDSWVGECFRDAALAVISEAGEPPAAVRAIGSHGQTLRHRPDAAHRFTLQIGDPAIIAAGTGIETVADFRSVDVALGGEGAPLAPSFHEWLFRDGEQHRVVVNIGGIANITVLPAAGAVAGFDTGPGNALLDAWIRESRDLPFDRDGRWAAAGMVDDAMLDRLLGDSWFARQPPKSSGLEYFNLAWLAEHRALDARPVVVQATLSELTAATIANAIQTTAPETQAAFVCGGGAHNGDLLDRLRERLPGVAVQTTHAIGLDPDWVEAAAFAWLAKRRVEGLPGNLPPVTGASRPAVLGALYTP